MQGDRLDTNASSLTDAAAAVAHAATMLAGGINTTDVLTHLARAAEERLGAGATASILVLDDEGTLRNGASPNLPPDYLAAIDRIKPNPKIGTCAAAAATGKIVITADFFADDKWAELRHYRFRSAIWQHGAYPLKHRKDACSAPLASICARSARPPKTNSLIPRRWPAPRASRFRAKTAAPAGVAWTPVSVGGAEPKAGGRATPPRYTKYPNGALTP